MTQPVVTETDQARAAQPLVWKYVILQLRNQLLLVRELSWSQIGEKVTIFREHDVVELRAYFAPDGTIEDLLAALDRVVRGDASLGRDFELFALAQPATGSAVPFGEEPVVYKICARKKVTHP